MSEWDKFRGMFHDEPHVEKVRGWRLVGVWCGIGVLTFLFWFFVYYLCWFGRLLFYNRCTRTATILKHSLV